ncbi:MAG: hypothetical protein K2Y08_03725 [Alphaproteobacteria bacterium]|nr:hypothetical protein [Alphaproteobacteria bacterium]
MLKKSIAIYFFAFNLVLPLYLAHSVPTESDEFRHIHAFCVKFKLDDMDGVLLEELQKGGKTTKSINKYGVPEYIFSAAKFLYNHRRQETEFDLLRHLFTIIPEDKRSEAFNLLNAMVASNSIMFKTLAGFPGLKEELLNLPYVRQGE